MDTVGNKADFFFSIITAHVVCVDGQICAYSIVHHREGEQRQWDLELQSSPLLQRHSSGKVTLRRMKLSNKKSGF